ncbi:MAG: UvrD-helicase domain-containing protein [Bacteroidetes bacterium]|nr:UvrD-helicase domain-containing protein [Bacteroidota bacterium]
MNFTVYKSSAGSGKTFTLVKEYLKLALTDDQNPPQKYKHILAITFTNKAAAEMKERITRSLKELSHPEENNTTLLEIICEETGLDKSNIQSRAQNVLHTILHNYSDFAIGTIDSFVHRIVRTFAYDLQLPVNFEIEMDDNKLLLEVIDLLISKAGNDEHLTQALVEFTETKTEDEKSWHIERDLFGFSKNLLTEEGIVHLERLKKINTAGFLSIRKSLNETIKKFESTVKKAAGEAYQAIQQQGLEHSSFYQGKNGISKFFANICDENFDKLEPNSYVVKTIREDKWFSEKTSAEDKGKIENIKSKLSESFHFIRDIVEKQQSLYCLLKLINKNIYSLAVLNEIEKLLTEIKKQNNILHISEFNKIISNIVLNQPVPFIYERIGEKYNHYLVDEFQDTSVLQWQNLLPLIENSLSEGHLSMLVGDGKQAIYRWRGGEVEQFAQLPDIFIKEKNEFVLEREQTLKLNYNEKQLNKNYRSKKEIIDFNNSMFSVLAGKLSDAYATIYQGHAQQSDPDNTGGYVSINFVKGEGDEAEQQTLEQVYNNIINLQKEKFKLSDIAVLCRTNKTGNTIAEYLTAKGIGVLSADSLLLKNSKKVRFIGSVFRYINQPYNEITRVEILQYLVENGLIDQDLHTVIALLKNKHAWEFDALLKQNGFEFNQQHLIKLPLYELVEQVAGIFKLAAGADAFVRFFMDEVLGYTIKNNNSLPGFIEWWETRKENASMNVPDGTNAVNIMTIHRSKGLEFPAVILPFATWKISDGKKNLWVDLKHNEVPQLESALLPATKELQKTTYSDLYEEEKNKSRLDNINLLYVAFTRPEERLYIITGEPSKTPDNLGNVSDIFCFYLRSLQLWNDAQQHYGFGNSMPHIHKNTQSKKTVKQTDFISSDWRSILKIRANAPEVWNTDNVTSKKDFGLIVHAILAKVKSAEDLTPTLTQYLNEGVIDLQEKKILFQKLNNIIEHPQLKPLYAAGNTIKTEADIILPTGETYRPDRVVINRDSTVLIDYKTGTKQDKHIKQIKKYAELLSQMGYTNIRQYLVYIDDETSIFNLHKES